MIRSIEKSKNIPNDEGYQSTQWESVKQVALRLQMSEDWVYEKSLKGELPCYKIGGKWRYDPVEIDAYVLGERCKPSQKIRPRSAGKNPGLSRLPHRGTSKETRFQKVTGG